MNKIIAWLIARKVKNAAGELEAKGISVTKICMIVIAALKGAEYATNYLGQPFTFPNDVYVLIASIGGIALREGVDKSAPK